MFVIVFDFIHDYNDVWFFDGISNELHVTACNSFKVCVHYNDRDICLLVCSKLCDLGYPCHLLEVAR